MPKLFTKQFAFWFSLFVISRIFVLAHPPYVMPNPEKGITGGGYSDVKQDSERYANMWKYGLTPYRKMLYEYPPAPIPVIMAALELDLAGLGYFYLNYRVLIFIFECVLFMGIYLTTRQPLALGFYIIAGVVAKDYWYDGLDLWFFGSLTLAYIVRLKHRVVFWTLFWWSVAIKLLTVPLLIPLAFLERKTWKKGLIACMLGGLIIWGLPLALYRSSLSVFLTFHKERPLKYGSFGTFVVKAANDFTHTETQTDILPHKPIVGPVAKGVETTLYILFPLSILVVLGWAVKHGKPTLPSLIQIAYALTYGVDLSSYGVEMVQSGNPDMDCFGYIFGSISIDKIHELINQAPVVDNLVVGAIAVYLDPDTGGKVHVGKVIENAKVLSKWGYGNVYKHPPLNTPFYTIVVEYRLI